jgi:hypothetical protein
VPARPSFSLAATLLSTSLSALFSFFLIVRLALRPFPPRLHDTIFLPHSRVRNFSRQQHRAAPWSPSTPRFFFPEQLYHHTQHPKVPFFFKIPAHASERASEHETQTPSEVRRSPWPSKSFMIPESCCLSLSLSLSRQKRGQHRGCDVPLHEEICSLINTVQNTEACASSFYFSVR